jgi:hypothetical protein
VFPIPWYVVLLVSIPEAFLIILIGFALFNLKIDIRTALIISIFEAIAVYIQSDFSPVIFGLHTVLQVFWYYVNTDQLINQLRASGIPS